MDFSVELIVDDVSQGIHFGSVGVAFATTTVLLGHGAGSQPANMLAYFDDVDVIRNGVPQLGNVDFESAINGYGTGPSGATWGRARIGGAPTADTSAVEVHGGSLAGRVIIVGGGGGAYLFQDLTMLPGESFDLDGWVYYSGPGEAEFKVIFDWDRGGGFTSGEANVFLNTGGTDFEAWGIGGSAPPIPMNQWVHVILRIDTTNYGWVVGEVQVGDPVLSGWQ